LQVSNIKLKIEKSNIPATRFALGNKIWRFSKTAKQIPKPLFSLKHFVEVIGRDFYECGSPVGATGRGNTILKLFKQGKRFFGAQAPGSLDRTPAGEQVDQFRKLPGQIRPPPPGCNLPDHFF
jgi:hypothetical protein